MPRTPFADIRSRFLAGKLGLGVFLISLGVLFGATLIAFLALRLQLGLSGKWPHLPSLPGILWLSTLAIVASSGTMQFALGSVRRDRPHGLQAGLLLTLVLGFAFLGMQAIAWVQWIAPVGERWLESGEWRFALTCFYVFTGLHALHVVGGLVPMSLVTLRGMRGRYSAADHLGVQLCAMYWHFLDIVWLALFATLMIGV